VTYTRPALPMHWHPLQLFLPINSFAFPLQIYRLLLLISLSIAAHSDNIILRTATPVTANFIALACNPTSCCNNDAGLKYDF
jgi:hypothetical protein